MQLRTAIFVAFGAALTAGQTVHFEAATVAVDGENGQAAQVPVSIFPEKKNPAATTAKTCHKPPMMPKTFFAKRKIWSILNTIVFYNRELKEIAYVQSWFMDWKNPFGFPGASLYLHDRPSSSSSGAEFGIEPREGENGWQSTNSAPLAEQGNTQQALMDAANEQERKAGTGSFDAENNKAGRISMGLASTRVAAWMTGRHETLPIEINGKKINFPAFTGVFNPEMTVKDCKGEHLFKAADGKLKTHNAGHDATFTTEMKDMENSLTFTDMGTPPVELVRVSMKEPCTPFPPFCQQMGSWNWFFHGNEWEGQITQPGYNETVSSSIVAIKLVGSAATDMRFITLYTAYQFSNTRWSPMMFIPGWILFFLCCCGGCSGCRYCCNKCCGGGASKAIAAAQEETEKLLKTTKSEPAPEKSSSPWACCSRRGTGRSVGLV